MRIKLRGDYFLKGFLSGSTVIVSLSLICSLANKKFQEISGRPLFLKQDAPFLLILVVMVMIFRWQIVDRGNIETGKGIFLSIFITSMMYFANKKYNFVVW